MRVVRRQPAFVDQADVHARPVEVGVRERRAYTGAGVVPPDSSRRARSLRASASASAFAMSSAAPAAQRPTSSLSCQSTRAVPVFTPACRRPRRPRSPRSRAGPVADAPPPASAPAPSPGRSALVLEPLAEAGALQRRQQFRHQSAGEEHAVPRAERQHEVAGDGAEHRAEHVHGAHRERIAPARARSRRAVPSARDRRRRCG